MNIDAAAETFGALATATAIRTAISYKGHSQNIQRYGQNLGGPGLEPPCSIVTN